MLSGEFFYARKCTKKTSGAARLTFLMNEFDNFSFIKK